MNFSIIQHSLSPAWHWRLSAKDNPEICKSSRIFASAAECRADIARFKKAAGGVRFAKVVGDA